MTYAHSLFNRCANSSTSFFLTRVRLGSPQQFLGKSPQDCLCEIILKTNWMHLCLSQWPFSRWTWVSRYNNVSVLDFVGAKGDESGGDKQSCKTCKAPVKSSPPTNQQPVFLQAGCPFCRPTTSIRALKDKYYIPKTCSTQAHLGSSNFVFYHSRLLVTSGQGCHASH